MNGVRNAIDSTIELNRAAPPDSPIGRILVTWGDDDRSLWVVVLDRGVGLPPGFYEAFEIGTTTKSKETHLGMGLAIARRAARSIGGEVSLTPRAESGASFELTWPGKATGQ